MIENSVTTQWGRSTAEGRWCGFGPYYAMFPIEFARKQIETFSKVGGSVVDPFCGRGTVPFVAQVTGRRAIGTDVNPVAWVYTAVKLDPYEDVSKLNKRVRELLDLIAPEDGVPSNEFQKWAWHTDVLSFLNSARRNLVWRSDRCDRTLMGLILVHLHAKLGEGLSNQLRQAKSMAPDYAVRWWKDRGMHPPKIDVDAFFERKLLWRYHKGIPVKRATAKAILGDARELLPTEKRFKADFVLTSPPYCGVTNYEYDNWIRLWMLGGPSLPSFSHTARYQDKQKYRELIDGVFSATQKVTKKDATIYVRTDAREYTLQATAESLLKTWPKHSLYCKFDKAKGPTQTALFGHDWVKAGEVDFIMLKDKASYNPQGFELIKAL